MKKLVVALAIATVAISCKKIQAGGNKDTLKLEEGVQRYSDDHQGATVGHDHAAAPAHHEEAAVAAPKADSATATKPAEEHAAAPAEH